MTRYVIERDLRMPEFKDAEPEDLEFRDDGKLVRKDRWKTGIMQIACGVRGARWEFEIDDVVEAVRALLPPDNEGEDEGIEAAWGALP